MGDLLDSRMKVSVLISCRNRADVLRRSLWLLERQTWPDYEILISDDGSDEDIRAAATGCKRVEIATIRPPLSPIRNCPIGLRHAFDRAKGEFIIISHPELMVPLNAIEKLVKEYEPGYRIVPRLYFICDSIAMAWLESTDWQSDLDLIQTIPNFWASRTPWGNTNKDMDSWIGHTAFCGQTRAEWGHKGFLPDDGSPAVDVAWIDAAEARLGRMPRQASFAVYHQDHARGDRTMSARIARTALAKAGEARRDAEIDWRRREIARLESEAAAPMSQRVKASYESTGKRNLLEQRKEDLEVIEEDAQA